MEACERCWTNLKVEWGRIGARAIHRGVSMRTWVSRRFDGRGTESLGISCEVLRGSNRGLAGVGSSFGVGEVGGGWSGYLGCSVGVYWRMRFFISGAMVSSPKKRAARLG